MFYLPQSIQNNNYLEVHVRDRADTRDPYFFSYYGLDKKYCDDLNNTTKISNYVESYGSRGSNYRFLHKNEINNQLSSFKFKDPLFKDLSWRYHDKINSCLGILAFPTFYNRNIANSHLGEMFTLDDLRKTWFSLLKQKEELPNDFIVSQEVIDNAEDWNTLIQRFVYENKINPMYSDPEKSIATLKNSYPYFDIPEEVLNVSDLLLLTYMQENLDALQKVLSLNYVSMMDFLKKANPFVLKGSDNVGLQQFQDKEFANTSKINNTYQVVTNKLNKDLIPETTYYLANRRLNYLVKNTKYEFEHKGLKAYSAFDKSLFDRFGYIVDLDLNLDLDSKVTDIHDNVFTKTEPHNFTFDVHPINDFSLIDDVYISDTENVSPKTKVNTIRDIQFSSKTFLKELTMEKIPFQNGKVNALVFENLYSKPESINYKIEPLTKTQLTKSYAVIPVLVKTSRLNIQNLDNDNDLHEDCYYACLFMFNSITQLKKYAKFQNYLIDFNNKLKTPNSIGLFDAEAYSKFLNERFGKVVKYSRKLIETLKPGKFLDSFIDSRNPLTKPIDENFLAIVNGNLIIDKKIEEEFNKLNTVKESIIDVLQNKESNLNLFNRDLRSNEEEINRTNEYLNRLLSKKDKIDKDIIYAQQEYQAQKKLADSFMTNYEKVAIKYNSAKDNALLNKLYEQDSFFKGLSSRGIYISQVNYYDGTVLNRDLSSQITDITAFKKKEISNLTLIINKPVKIKVDGDSNNCVYGGPYKVKVNSDGNLEIALLNNSSLIGHDPSSKVIFVHPHASSYSYSNTNDSSELFNFKRGCTGEAGPYLYKAFQNNDLKMIVTNIMIWVSSANSSDAWGRNYKYFMDSKDVILENIDLESIEENDWLIISDSQPIADNENEYNENQYEDDDYCEHEFDNEGECYHCGYYDEDYDATLNQEETTPREEQTTYIPYSTVQNINETTNNN